MANFLSPPLEAGHLRKGGAPGIRSRGVKGEEPLTQYAQTGPHEPQMPPPVPFAVIDNDAASLRMVPVQRHGR